MKLHILLVGFLMISFQGLKAQEHPIDISNMECQENISPTTADMVNCENQALQAWEAEMDQVYAELLNLLESPAKENLALAQRKWNDALSANTMFKIGYFRQVYDGGTIMRIAMATDKKEWVRSRTLELSGWLEDLKLVKGQ